MQLRQIIQPVASFDPALYTGYTYNKQELAHVELAHLEPDAMETIPISTGDQEPATELDPAIDVQIERLREFLDTQQEQLDRLKQDLDAKQAEWRRLAESQQGAAAVGNEAPQENYRQRYEKAMEDIRELKATNAELRQQIQSQKTHPDLGGGAEPGDEFDAGERKQLGQLQDEWHEKLRRAEIEMSLQRAEIARDRAQIKERLRVIENEPTPDDEPQQAGKPVRGRWLAKLGLSNKK